MSSTLQDRAADVSKLVARTVWHALRGFAIVGGASVAASFAIGGFVWWRAPHTAVTIAISIAAYVIALPLAGLFFAGTYAIRAAIASVFAGHADALASWVADRKPKHGWARVIARFAAWRIREAPEDLAGASLIPFAGLLVAALGLAFFLVR